MSATCADGYKSDSQKARLVTEEWGARELYCLACPRNKLRATPVNTKAVDFECANCGAPYQLKAGKRPCGSRVPDGAYSAMMEAIRADRTPHLLIMQYSSAWRVLNLMAVPRFFLTASAVLARNPLAATAQRAGWIGCDISLAAIAPEGKLSLVANAGARSPSIVRAEFARVLGIARIAPQARGWTLDVLALVRSLGQREFSLVDVYAHEHRLQVLHPDNHHVRPKIRQQLQVLRDMGMLRFGRRGTYSLVDTKPFDFS